MRDAKHGEADGRKGRSAVEGRGQELVKLFLMSVAGNGRRKQPNASGWFGAHYSGVQHPSYLITFNCKVLHDQIYLINFRSHCYIYEVNLNV